MIRAATASDLETTAEAPAARASFSTKAGVGLAGMRERLNELNGKLEIESDGHGTIMRAIVPLPANGLPRPETADSLLRPHTPD